MAQRRITRVDPFADMVIPNPKRHMDSIEIQESRLFPYYAGYSTAFAEQLLRSLKLHADAVVLDPWNGSGTTTSVARNLGYNAVGIDLNPAMVIVAKAGMLSSLEAPSLAPLAQSLVEQAITRTTDVPEKDPLCTWLSPQSAAYVRAIELEINHTLVSFDGYSSLSSSATLDKVSPLAAFFYVALFCTTRRLLTDFIPTNPTWTKKPDSPQNRKKPSMPTIVDAFLIEVELLSEKLFASQAPSHEEGHTASVEIGNAEMLRLSDRSIDAIITSPPYCTRIDYAVATAIELAVLGLTEKEFDTLRRTLTGTSTVERSVDGIDAGWGKTCINFLEQVYAHQSKASKTYYFKNHLQYFRSLSRSIAELGRVLSKDGSCVLVVQDSHYKDIHNNVPTIACEMATEAGLSLVRREDFSSSRSMAGLNKLSKKYLTNRTTTESVLCFRVD